MPVEHNRIGNTGSTPEATEGLAVDRVDAPVVGMSPTGIVLLAIAVPVLLFFIWLRGQAESEYSSAWGRVFRSWRRVWPGGIQRDSWTGMRITMTFLAAAMVVSGLVFIGRGVITLRDPPRPPERSFSLYVMSGQVEDIGSGLIGIALGVIAYRYGRKH